MNPILIVLLLTSVVVAFVLMFGRKSEATEEEQVSSPSIEVPAPEAMPPVTCPVCPACPVPKPCPEGPQPIRIILETPGGPLAHQNQILVRESPYRPLYTPVDPTLFLKNPTVRVPA